MRSMLARSLLAWILLPALLAAADESPDVTKSPPADEFLIIPLRVHILTAKNLPEVDCALTDADIARILGKVNRIWNVAGIHWGLESLVREPAARQECFRAVRDLDGKPSLGAFRLLWPEGSRRFDGLHVYFIHEFAVNGVWMGEDYVVVQETAQLRPVDGGIDEPIPRVTAHELGHTLGLEHRQNRTNLLASGTTGTLLNAHEVAMARGHARTVPGVKSVRELREEAKRAEGQGDAARARRYARWLSEIPGLGPDDGQRVGDERK